MWYGRSRAAHRQVAFGVAAAALAAVAATGGCVSYEVRAEPTRATADRVVCSADVVRSTDYPIDVACGGRRETVVGRYTVEYARVAGDRLTAVSVARAGPETPTPPTPDGSSFLRAADLRRPDLVGPTDDPAWHAALGRAAEFLASLQPLDPDASSPVWLTADRNWVVVRPATVSGSFAFGDRTFAGASTVVAFGRAEPDGRAITAKDLGCRPTDYGCFLGAESTGGALRLFCDDPLGSRVVVATPFAGRQTSLAYRGLVEPTWDATAGTITLLSRGRNRGQFGVDVWSAVTDRRVTLNGDVSPLFRRSGDGMVPVGP